MLHSHRLHATTTRHSVQHTSPPRHNEIGTVSLPASVRGGACKGRGLQHARIRTVPHRTFILIVVPVQPRPCTVAPLYVKSNSVTALAIDWHPEYVPDYFQTLNNSSSVHDLPNPQISRKSAHNCLWVNSLTDIQTNTSQNITPPNCGGGDN